MLGITTDAAKRDVVACAEQLGREGAEGIVLGCTELPFLIKQPDLDLPVFDTTAIHAEKALQLALK